ncbi:MAG: polysaccharide deacetylase [Ruminococcaceae bacterium]|nr:polysaccharide deacetylase [Oscillospiraceae bacterium]
MAKKTTDNKKYLWILAVVSVLCICFGAIIAVSFWVPEPDTQEVVVAKPSPTPKIVPTPFPTKEPGVIPVSEDPNDPYPEIYGENPNQEFAPTEDYVVYLTFDDGPSNSTPALLTMLKEEGVPATFFVFSDAYPEILKQAYEDGHTLGIHTNSHVYRQIYQSLDAYLYDFAKCFQNIVQATGYTPRIFRFPGGSVNSYNRNLAWTLVTEMERRGFVYYDWNVTSEDAAGATTYEDQLNELITQSQNKSRIIALMHDTDANPWIADLVRDYIGHMKALGYHFASLDPSVQPVQFPLP